MLYYIICTRSWLCFIITFLTATVLINYYVGKMKKWGEKNKKKGTKHSCDVLMRKIEERDMEIFV